MFLDNRNVRRSFVFALESSLVAVLAYVFSVYNMRSTPDAGTGTIKFGMLVLKLIAEVSVAFLNLLPAYFIRYVIARDEMYGASAIAASLCNYSSIRLLIILPYKAVTGTLPMASFYAPLEIAAEILWAVLSYAAGLCVVTLRKARPPSDDEMFVPLDDAAKCMISLGEFMNLVKSQLRESRPMENLWQPVLEYIKTPDRVRKLILNQRLSYDEIILNAVGSIAFRLLSSGELHSGPGVLSPDGEYVRKGWWIAAKSW